MVSAEIGNFSILYLEEKEIPYLKTIFEESYVRWTSSVSKGI